MAVQLLKAHWSSNAIGCSGMGEMFRFPTEALTASSLLLVTLMKVNPLWVELREGGLALFHRKWKPIDAGSQDSHYFSNVTNDGVSFVICTRTGMIFYGLQQPELLLLGDAHRGILMSSRVRCPVGSNSCAFPQSQRFLNAVTEYVKEHKDNQEPLQLLRWISKKAQTEISLDEKDYRQYCESVKIPVCPNFMLAAGFSVTLSDRKDVRRSPPSQEHRESWEKWMLRWNPNFKQGGEANDTSLRSRQRISLKIDSTYQDSFMEKILLYAERRGKSDDIFFVLGGLKEPSWASLTDQKKLEFMRIANLNNATTELPITSKNISTLVLPSAFNIEVARTKYAKFMSDHFIKRCGTDSGHDVEEIQRDFQADWDENLTLSEKTFWTLLTMRHNSETRPYVYYCKGVRLFANLLQLLFTPERSAVDKRSKTTIKLHNVGIDWIKPTWLQLTNDNITKIEEGAKKLYKLMTTILAAATKN